MNSLELERVRLNAIANRNLRPQFSGVLALFAGFSSFVMALWVAPPLVMTGVTLTIFCLIFLILPLLGVLRSQNLNREQLLQLAESLKLPENVRIKIRSTSSSEPSAYDLGIVRWINLPRNQILDAIGTGEGNKLRARLVHELVHYYNRDPIRLKLLLFWASVTISSIIWVVVEVVFRESNRLSYPENSELYLILLFSFLYFFMAAISVFALWQFIHEREYSADKAAYDCLGDDYKSYLSQKAKLEKYRVAKNTLVRCWNKLVHPTFQQRLRRLDSPIKEHRFLLGVTVVHSVAIFANIPLLSLLVSSHNNYHTIFSENAFPWLLQYGGTLTVWFLLYQWLFHFFSIATIARLKNTAWVTSLAVALLALVAMHTIEGVVIEKFLNVLIINGIEYSLQLKTAAATYWLLRPSFILGLGIFFTLLTLVAPSHNDHSPVLAFLQTTNAAIFVFRMIFISYSTLFDPTFVLSKLAESTFLTVLHWLVAEFLLALIWFAMRTFRKRRIQSGYVDAAR